MPRPTRVLLAKPTHDCHDRGIRYLARVLRDAGYEVIFMNFLLADEVVHAAVAEDVAVIGISSSSGGHLPAFEDLMEGLEREGADDIVVIGGGVIPPNHVRELKDIGVGEVFGPGASAEDALSWLSDRLQLEGQPA